MMRLKSLGILVVMAGVLSGQALVEDPVLKIQAQRGAEDLPPVPAGDPGAASPAAARDPCEGYAGLASLPHRPDEPPQGREEGQGPSSGDSRQEDPQEASLSPDRTKAFTAGAGGTWNPLKLEIANDRIRTLR